MPLVLDPPRPEDPCTPCTLGECIEALARLEFDPDCEGSVRETASWLARLNANPTFLAEVLVDRLAGRVGAEVTSDYGPQALVLSPMIGKGAPHMFLRANIWPAKDDLVFRTSGASAFVYGTPHDHDFAFLTAGHLGPGYESDYFEYDYEDVAGHAGEAVDLRFVERSALHEGKLMLYRAHRDVHSQLPPKSLSVSLNVMHFDPAQCWFDQYAFDLGRREVARVLSPNASEAFLRVAVASGAQDALDYAEQVGRSHPSERLRLASFEARAARLAREEEDALWRAKEDALWREGESSGSRMVANVAKARRAALETA